LRTKERKVVGDRDKVRPISLVWARFERAARVFESATSLSLLAVEKRGKEEGGMMIKEKRQGG
jgi:hypothetical protein